MAFYDIARFYIIKTEQLKLNKLYRSANVSPKIFKTQIGTECKTIVQ